MNYELLKQNLTLVYQKDMYSLLKSLKEVGFPQRTHVFWCEDLKVETHKVSCAECGGENLANPSTDELIEELGDKFWKVERVNYGENKGTWVAWIQHGENYNTLMMTGSTPKEALINLYIALNLHKYGKTN